MSVGRGSRRALRGQGLSDPQPGQAQTSSGPQAGRERQRWFCVAVQPFACGLLAQPGTGVCKANSPEEKA